MYLSQLWIQPKFCIFLHGSCIFEIRCSNKFTSTSQHSQNVPQSITVDVNVSDRRHKLKGYWRVKIWNRSCPRIYFFLSQQRYFMVKPKLFVHVILLFSIFCTLNIRIVLVFYLQLLFFIGQFYIKLLISAIGGNCNVQYFVEWYVSFLSFKKMVLAVRSFFL